MIASILYIALLASVVFFIVLCVKCVLYSYHVAKSRNHNNSLSVLLVFFIPIIGFFASLAWAFSNDVDNTKKALFNNKYLILRGIKIYSLCLLSFISICCFTLALASIKG